MMQDRLTGMQSLLLGRPLLVIVFAVSMFISTESAFTAENESIDQATRNLLESLIATHENVLDASRVVSYDFASQYISTGKKIVVSGVADANQARFRIDYRSTTTVDGTGASKDSGTCLKTPTELIDYHPELKVAYISSDPKRDRDTFLRVLPQDCWFSYDMQFSLSEVLSGNGVWDFSGRRLTIDRREDSIDVQISPESGSGFVKLTFKKYDSFLIHSVENRKDGQLSYSAEYQWKEAAGVWYPENIRMFRPGEGREEHEPRFELKISAFSSMNRTSPLSWNREALKIPPDVEQVVFKPGRSPILVKPRTKDRSPD